MMWRVLPPTPPRHDAQTTPTTMPSEADVRPRRGWSGFKKPAVMPVEAQFDSTGHWVRAQDCLPFCKCAVAE
eukprot:15476195-Alexandrium_andersonii.AAC.1